jgi:hypothetical protein
MVQVISLEMFPFVAVVRAAHGNPISRLVGTVETQRNNVVNFEFAFGKRVTTMTALVMISTKESLPFLIGDGMPLDRGFWLVYRKTLAQQHKS